MKKDRQCTNCGKLIERNRNINAHYCKRCGLVASRGTRVSRINRLKSLREKNKGVR